MISGNKIVNGWGRKSGEGDVTILNNEFTSDLPVQHGIVGLGGKSGQAIVKDNVMRFLGGNTAVTAGREVNPTARTKPKRPETRNNSRPRSPRSSTRPGAARGMTMLLAEGNVIQVFFEQPERPFGWRRPPEGDPSGSSFAATASREPSESPGCPSPIAAL